MSRTRVADGSDEHGRPKGRWTEAEPVTTPYGFMEPAIPPTIERRKATDEEMAAARAREDEPGHLTRPSLGTPPLLVGRIREEPEPPMIDELHQWRRMPSEADVPTVKPADPTPAQLPAVTPLDIDPIDSTIETLAVLADAVEAAAEARAERLRARQLTDQAKVNWQQARAALDAAYRALLDPPEATPSVDAIARAAALFQRGALQEARASVALDGETQVVDRPKRVRTGEGQRPGQASARDRRAATVMSAMHRLDDDMDAVAAELGMKKNAVSQVVKHARLRAGTAS